jgi:glyoxylase-like metal-dependent hydrolase (beta-lactamase superfamily II)
MSNAEEIGLRQDLPVAVVCAHGNSSKPATAFLSYMGFDARSMRGGMAAWMLLNVERRLDPPPGLDALIQCDRVGKGALGYVLVSDGEALVVDPSRDLTAYRAVLESSAGRLIGVADTHCHADYISGGPGLARAMHVPYYLHESDAIYPYDGTPGVVAYTAVDAGQTIRVGRAAVDVVHTPGHTEGSVSYVIDGEVALTGDFVFVGSVGRPDLAGQTEPWTVTLWNSIERARADWGDDMRICPAHYGTDAERQPDRSVWGRFGDLRTTNEGLTIDTFDEFAAWVRSRTGTFPDSYAKIKAVNVGLMAVDELQAEELEVGKNECAIA